ncbi:hypothetical protein DFH29DRAFT_1078690 [Suillus ampliporus]|nr:hypothetical protein DFH29DRAFT_1078690 [Suillus ampliporus]
MEKLLILLPQGHIELYDVEDLSKAPLLQASFVLPVPVNAHRFRFQFPSVSHSPSSCARLALTYEHWIWTTNPADRVICVEAPTRSWPIIAISARVFFMDIPPTWIDTTSEGGRVVPWSSWGPQNSRCFPLDWRLFGVGGSRIVWPVHVSGSGFRLHMVDFNPCAIARGIGKVVREPSSTDFDSEDVVTTYLPYMEVVSDLVFDGSPIDIILNEERLLVFAVMRTGRMGDLNVEIINM